jgi:sugar phosphate isomerase/epimerase
MPARIRADRPVPTDGGLASLTVMDGSSVSLSTAALFARPLGDTFALAADCGYVGVEVMVTKDPASQDPHQMRRLADLHGLELRALHAPALLLTRSVWGADPIGKIDTATRVARAAGIPLVVMHPPYRWQREYRRWLLSSLTEVEHHTGVTVAIENMFPVHIGSKRLTFHANQDIDQLAGLPHLVLDTSHAAVARHDPIEVRRAFGDRLRHVHLSDNAGKGWDSHLPPGEGVLPLGAFLDDLSSSDYAGAITLEVDLRRQLTDDAALRTIMVSMREAVERRLAEPVHRREAG